MPKPSLNWLLIFLPITLLLAYATHAPDALIGQSTENLSAITGPTLGGLLNATFGNATQMIIAFFALRARKIEVVKASITGSMISNMLVVARWRQRSLVAHNDESDPTNLFDRS